MYTRVYVDSSPCITVFPLYVLRIEGRAQGHVVGRWLLLPAVVMSADSTPHLPAFEVGGTLSEWPP